MNHRSNPLGISLTWSWYIYNLYMEVYISTCLTGAFPLRHVGRYGKIHRSSHICHTSLAVCRGRKPVHRCLKWAIRPGFPGASIAAMIWLVVVVNMGVSAYQICCMVLALSQVASNIEVKTKNKFVSHFHPFPSFVPNIQTSNRVKYPTL